MKYLKSKSGSILPMASGLITILLIGVLGTINITYLVGKRFQLQSELDFLALQLVQQIDYSNYFEIGFSDDLGLDLDAIDQQIAILSQSGDIARCENDIRMTVIGLQVDLQLECETELPAPIPGLPATVVFDLASSARLAQSSG